MDQAAETAARRPVIALVEDDTDIRETIRAFLEMEGYQVASFENGKQALDGLQQSTVQPCLVLLDLMMPVMDGYEFLRERTQLGETIRSVPVVVISAFSDSGEAGRSGAKGYLKKPADLDALLRVARQYCGAPRTS
jgi:CheY-like chemotaxis protein